MRGYKGPKKKKAILSFRKTRKKSIEKIKRKQISVLPVRDIGLVELLQNKKTLLTAPQYKSKK